MKEFAEKFKGLIQQKKFEEAKKLLGTLHDFPESIEERVELKLFLTNLYLDAMNAADREYIEILEDTLKKLKELETMSRKADEGTKLAKARADLK